MHYGNVIQVVETLVAKNFKNFVVLFRSHKINFSNLFLTDYFTD